MAEAIRIGPEEVKKLADEGKSLFGWVRYDECKILLEQEWLRRWRTG